MPVGWCVQNTRIVPSTYFKKGREMVSKSSTQPTQKNMAPTNRSRPPVHSNSIRPVSEWLHEKTDIATVWGIKHKGKVVDIILEDVYSSFI